MFNLTAPNPANNAPRLFSVHVSFGLQMTFFCFAFVEKFKVKIINFAVRCFIAFLIFLFCAHFRSFLQKEE